MYKFFYIILFVSTNLFASDLGITGVIDTPSARMQDDGTLKITFSHQGIANITNITYQATPWLETTFRYAYGSLPYKDRSYAAKITLLKESEFKPNIACLVRLFSPPRAGRPYFFCISSGTSSLLIASICH